ncbi:MAG: endonuclease/exonuclease/phosphatase family protein [Anaerolineales bacterium]|jgi:endonuclease/exonuclease/phosphatase family metal-dependent hydrolase
MAPKITDPIPNELKGEFANLNLALDEDLPAKVLDRNLLIATWNIRAFGNMTKSWRAGPDDSPKRDIHAVREIAEIISRFHIIAIQEARANLRALRHMLKVLGPHWGVILTDVTKGKRGNYERMAFVFDSRVVQLSGLACELVVPPERVEDKEIKEDALRTQFARTPYAVGFKVHGKTFILVTMHAYYGRGTTERRRELRAIAEWMADWANDIYSYGQNLILLGDFNIDRRGDQLFDAFTSTGLCPPEELNAVPRTIFSDASDTGKFYDQIAWFSGEGGVPALTMKYCNAGYFNFTKVALKSLNLTKQALSWRISDHYPLWVEFSLRD